MYFKEDRLVLTVERRDIYEHQINALINNSLHDVFTNNVHHLNHCGYDNRIENLKVLSHSEHSKYHNTGSLNPNFNNKPRIRDSGFTEYGVRRWSLIYNNDDYFASSTDYNKLKSILDVWDEYTLDELKQKWDDLNSNNVPYPRIIKAGFKKGKQNYKIVYNKKTIKQSVNLETLKVYYRKLYNSEPILSF